MVGYLLMIMEEKGGPHSKRV